MAVSHLYKISLLKTFSLLNTGKWNACDRNPFSSCPTKIIDDLLLLVYSDAKCMVDMRLLLTSGRIQYLHLMKMNHNMQRELGVLLKMLSPDVCRNIQKISIPKKLKPSSIPLLENVLRMCPNLKDIYSEILFDLNALKDCKALRCLRFHAEREELFNFTSQADFDVLRSLNSLEIFAFCNGYNCCFVDPQAVAKILLKCPNLISVGYVDSIMALAYIPGKEQNPPPEFNLRWCYWGHSEWDLTHLRSLKEYDYTVYLDYIKNAVSLYPLVEDLEILVYHKDCLQYLSKLKRLTFLCVNFYRETDNFIPDFMSLLEKIGPQLRFLRVEMRDTISLTEICDECPRLESLFLVNPRASENDVPSLCLKHLKRFSCVNTNRETLLFLLSNCPNLTILFLSDAECLDDVLLASILQKNPLSQLKVVSISECSLSKNGLRLFLQSVPTLENVLIRSKRRDFYKEIAELISDLNLSTQQNLRSRDDLELPNFFYRKKYWCIF